MKQNVFQSVSGNRPLSSQFDLSHNRKFSFKPGILYPVLNAEAVPSDVFNYDANAVVRMAPMLSPVMHMVDVCMHSFFVPERLLMGPGLWEVFITGGALGDGKDARGNTVEPPYFVVNGEAVSTGAAISITQWMGPGSLPDFLGFQYSSDGTIGSDETRINARPFIAFWLIWNEYFRDQNVDLDVVGLYESFFKSSGGDITSVIFGMITGDPGPAFNPFVLPRVCWTKDYFTSALPFAQRGEAVEAPLTGNATITYRNPAVVAAAAGSATQALGVRDGTPNVNRSSDGTFDDPAGDTIIDNISSIALNAGGFTITALRTAARLQEWLEKMATGGSRYVEQIKAMFGVTSSDARLQRPEYLGGGKIPMHISEVIQSSADDGTPLAEMAGHGVTAGQVTGYRKFCEEHGFFMSFIFLRPQPAYQQGLPRMWWRRNDKLDYLWPTFARIGEQEVLTKEVYYRNDADDDDDIFGYQQRYAEYKYIPSTVHGEFRTTLDFWHWGRQFDAVPTLSPEFVHCDPSDRIFNVLSTGTDSLYCIVNNRITARRPLPYYGEPQL